MFVGWRWLDEAGSWWHFLQRELWATRHWRSRHLQGQATSSPSPDYLGLQLQGVVPSCTFSVYNVCVCVGGGGGWYEVHRIDHSLLDWEWIESRFSWWTAEFTAIIKVPRRTNSSDLKWFVSCVPRVCRVCVLPELLSVCQARETEGDNDYDEEAEEKEAQKEGKNKKKTSKTFRRCSWTGKLSCTEYHVLLRVE